MYLYLGGDTLAHTGEVIGLFDLDTTTLSKKTRDFLSRAEKSGQVVNTSFELPKSFVLIAGKTRGNTAKNHTVYISQLSPGTLKKRIGAL